MECMQEMHRYMDVT